MFVAALMAVPMVAGQAPSPQRSDGITVQGILRDSAHNLVCDALVRLEQKDAPDRRETKTNARGAFGFSNLRTGSYMLSAEKSGLHSRAIAVIASSREDHKQVDLVLGDSQVDHPVSSAFSAPSVPAMEFTDKPNFSVEGVTDWTAAGGHGSDSSLRTSEALTRETLTLKAEDQAVTAVGFASAASEAKAQESKLRAPLTSAPRSFETNHQLGEFYLHTGRYRESVPLLEASYQIDPTNHGNEYDLALAYKGSNDLLRASEHVQNLMAHDENAELHRLSGELREMLGDPLAAVHEFEQAVRLDSTEQNYFEWGSELLLHRAVWQSQEIFRRGTKAHPASVRMLTGLGTALFAGALYEEAALRLCDASDLNPDDPGPYIFMGKIEMAVFKPLPCVEQKLARFLREQPANSLANYLCAMAIWKRQQQQSPPDLRALEEVKTLLIKAVTIDPKNGDAYLQLGILYSSQRDPGRAIGYYAKAIEVNPQLGEAYYRLGMAYDRMGDPVKAKQEFQLHDEIEKRQAAAVERQRHEVKQFLVVLPSQPTPPRAH